MYLGYITPPLRAFMKKVHIKVSDLLHEKIRVAAARKGATIQDFVENLMEFGLDAGPVQQPEKKGDFRFIDLFAGIGGMRRAFESINGECVFSSEWDKFSQKTYADNFGGEIPRGDITKILESEIPEHDVLLAGFPCQPFSLAGVSKKNSMGRKHGFLDETQGTLFFDIVRILKHKRPRAFLLENVKNLASHDGGKTFRVIKGSLEELGYKIFCKVVDARNWVPQHRERIFIVGFDKEVYGDEIDFHFPEPKKGQSQPKLDTILDKNSEIDPRYTLSDKLYKYLDDYRKKHQAAGNGFGYSLFGPDGVARTLSARYHKDGSEILIKNGRKNPRRLTPRECARLMGYPESHKITVSDTQAYRQFGNSVVVPVVTAIAEQMGPILMASKVSRVSKRKPVKKAESAALG